jgi:hypothetical protein
MTEPEDNETTEAKTHPLRDGLSGLGQKIIGEIETIGGILTADPNTHAEGEFNVEVGDVREELESDLEQSRETRPAEGEDN